MFVHLFIFYLHSITGSILQQKWGRYFCNLKSYKNMYFCTFFNEKYRAQLRTSKFFFLWETLVLNSENISFVQACTQLAYMSIPIEYQNWHVLWIIKSTHLNNIGFKVDLLGNKTMYHGRRHEVSVVRPWHSVIGWIFVCI